MINSFLFINYLDNISSYIKCVIRGPGPLIPTFYVIFPVICYPLLSVILIANTANKYTVNMDSLANLLLSSFANIYCYHSLLTSTTQYNCTQCCSKYANMKMLIDALHRLERTSAHKHDFINISFLTYHFKIFSLLKCRKEYITEQLLNHVQIRISFDNLLNSVYEMI